MNARNESETKFADGRLVTLSNRQPCHRCGAVKPCRVAWIEDADGYRAVWMCEGCE